MLGSLYYASPEQVMKSYGVDHRADIYSLGVILYEMLSGARPIDRSSHSDLLAAIVAGDYLPFKDVAPSEVGADLISLVTGAMARRPEDRLQQDLARVVVLVGASRDASIDETGERLVPLEG